MADTENNKNSNSPAERAQGNAPALRFPGFTEPWQKTTLGNCCGEMDYGMNAPAKEYDGVNKYIRITDIDEDSSEYNCASIVSPDGALFDKYLVNENDILFARTGSSTGKTYLYRPSDGRLYFAGFLIRANVKDDNDSNFIYHQCKLKRYWNWVRIMSARSGQPGINSQEYSTYTIYSTCKDEQIKISSLLKLLDERIATQRRLIEDLEKLKSSIAHHLFQQSAPIISLGELSSVTNGNADVQDATVKYKAGLYPFFDRSEQIKYLNNFYLDKVAIIYAGEGQNFFPRYYKGKFALHQRCYAVYDFDKRIIPRYCYHYMRQLNRYFQKTAVGSTVASLRMENFLNAPIKVPSISIQKYIVNVLDSIENKVIVEQQLISYFILQRKHLLSNLFI